jgi:hypothetical protein
MPMFAGNVKNKKMQESVAAQHLLQGVLANLTAPLSIDEWHYP